MISLNLDNVQEAGTGKKLPAGGYICKYTNVSDVADKQYLYMEFDVIEGEYANYYKNMETAKGFWGGKCYRSYKEKALPMFKRMCSAVAKSNPGFVFDGNINKDEQTLVGKQVGLVFGEEEYIGNDGSVKKRLYLSYECSIEDIRKGNYQKAKFKPLPDSERPKVEMDADEFISVPNDSADEVPWN